MKEMTEEERGTVAVRFHLTNEIEQPTRTLLARGMEDFTSTFAEFTPCCTPEYEIISPGSGRWHGEIVLARKMIEDARKTRAPMNTAWKVRERNRMSGDDPELQYDEIPDIGVYFNPDHYVHMAIGNKDPSAIAFTDTEDKGRRDIQTVMRLGRYLERHHPDMTPGMIESRVTQLVAHQSPADMRLLLTSDREMITEVFETRMFPSDSDTASCMYRHFNGWPENARPYHVYSDSDNLRVAYAVPADMMLQLTKDPKARHRQVGLDPDQTVAGAVVASGASSLIRGNVLARSVVNIETMKYVRIYSAGAADDMRGRRTLVTHFANALEQAGYKEGHLEGGKLTKIYCRRYSVKDDRLLAPYVDGAVAGVNSKWVLTGNDYIHYLNTTHGYLDEDGEELPSYYCIDCEWSTTDEDDLQWVDCRDGGVCETCRDNYVFASLCMSGQDLIPRDNAFEACDLVWYEKGHELIQEVDGEWHVEGCRHVDECGCCGERSTEDHFETVEACPDCVQ